ncbi:DUF1636 domain-containing protein [Aliiroseovarius crassostreae]|uniref:DUF1636 domain-containing protein n=1 Tax=Aliiroseovarius crassostreae TaxID=154981 RepID=UPI002207B94C|nr:DUF1636 domain-containing protein [Aliiroseovarius crassostreae]UWP89741.1 DUF1636 domain-containing protein [Aliiroseovarius crassostreae]
MYRTQMQTVGQTTTTTPTQKGQQLVLCTPCPHTGQICTAGHAMMVQLQQAITAARDSIEDGFEISGHAEMGGCGRTCLVAYHATRSETHVFGDVEEGEDISALLDFARNNHEALNRGTTPLSPSGLQRTPGCVMAMRRGAALF